MSATHRVLLVTTERLSLGARIRERRRAIFITQAELAARCGVTQSAVGQWERDVTIPSLRMRPVLAGALAVYPHQLFDDVEAVEVAS